MKPVLLVVFLICCKVFADDAQLRSDCENNRWVNDKCQKCPKCEQGYGLNMSCGNGHGAEAICVRCEESETFNNGSGHQGVMCINLQSEIPKYKGTIVVLSSALVLTLLILVPLAHHRGRKLRDLRRRAEFDEERKVEGSGPGALSGTKVKDERQRSQPASSASESNVMTSQYTYNAERTQSHKMPRYIEKLYDKALILCKEMDFGDLDLDIRDSIHNHLCNTVGKNFRHVGERFGFTLLEIQRFSGMDDLFAPLIHRKKTLCEFLQILKDLERFDVVKDLSDWIIGSRGAGCADDHASSLGAAVDETGDPTKTYLYAPLRP